MCDNSLMYKSDNKNKQGIQQFLSGPNNNPSISSSLQNKIKTTNKTIKQGETVEIRIKDAIVQWFVGATQLM